MEGNTGRCMTTLDKSRPALTKLGLVITVLGLVQPNRYTFIKHTKIWKHGRACQKWECIHVHISIWANHNVETWWFWCLQRLDKIQYHYSCLAGQLLNILWLIKVDLDKTIVIQRKFNWMCYSERKTRLYIQREDQVDFQSTWFFV